MKSILPWLCAVVLGAGAVYFFQSDAKKDAELTQLRPQAQEAQTLRTDLESAKAATTARVEEVNRLQKDNEDALRLRADVRRLQDENTQLTKQLQSAQATASSVQQQAQEQVTRLKKSNADLQSSVSQNIEKAQRNTCINNLRMIDGAKQQWALERNKTASAAPTVQDLTPYLKDGLPKCPNGGMYVIGTVEQFPTCTIPGHLLPQPTPQPPQ